MDKTFNELKLILLLKVKILYFVDVIWFETGLCITGKLFILILFRVRIENV